MTPAEFNKATAKVMGWKLVGDCWIDRGAPTGFTFTSRLSEHWNPYDNANHMMMVLDKAFGKRWIFDRGRNAIFTTKVDSWHPLMKTIAEIGKGADFQPAAVAAVTAWMEGQ